MRITNGNNLPRAKVTNQSSIREVIYHYGPISRGEISERLSLTLPTITSVINALLQKELIKEVPLGADGKKNLGRKATLIDIAENSQLFLGIEMRGSCRRVCVTNYRGKVLCSASDDTPQLEYDSCIRNVRDVTRTLLEENGLSLGRIAGMGICLPGLVDPQSGVLRMHPGYLWQDHPVREDLARELGYTGPIHVENNACARGYAMRLFHQDKLDSANTFAYLFVSLGIACPFFQNFIGPQQNPFGPGEAGHMVMNPNGPVCSCGNRGCLEAFSSEKAILARCRNAVEQGQAPVLAELCGEAGAISMDAILEAQERGDKAVCGILDEAIFYLGTAISNLYNFISPQRMVIECDLFQRKQNRENLLRVIRKGLYSPTITDVHFTFMDREPLSGAIGAAAVAIQNELQTYVE